MKRNERRRSSSDDDCSGRFGLSRFTCGVKKNENEKASDYFNGRYDNRCQLIKFKGG